MSIRVSTLTTASLLGALLVAGTLAPAHAGDGCSKDRKDKGTTTSSLWSPGAPTAPQTVLEVVNRP